ncbi:MAG: ATP synthase F0 subunit C [Bdellovibrionaceae bacterium]|nr:ATP synthase F0 subunit C [Pseudobdellovibrionaceae bacterium]MBX3033664.1 ATP synthase F0 subunit C [Pseudobdellovibrionaceae bacterium]
MAATIAAAPALAQEATTAVAAAPANLGLKPIAAAIAISVAALGGALAQGRTAATALDGIARNPAASGKIFTPMIIGLALIESLVIYALIIAFQLV